MGGLLTETIDLKPHRSVSQLTTWLQCGEAYRLQRIAKAPRRPAAWLLQGIAFHNAIEFWELEGRTPTPEQAVDEFDTSWTLEAENLPDDPLDTWLTGGRTKGEVDYARRVERGRQQVRDYIEWAKSTEAQWRIYRDSAFPNGMGVEVPFRIDLGPAKDVELIGYIDQVVEFREGGIIPRDLKTGTKRPKSPVQLGVYAMALRECHDIQTWHGDFFMCKDNSPTPLYNLERWTLPYITETFHTVNEAIEREIFIANPGDSCGVCDVWKWCRAVGPHAGEY